MSYNYLPLDNTPTSFQQIKNLLAYQQLISITFAGYEAIEKHREAINNNPTHAGNADATELMITYGQGMGEKIPTEIVKLMLALKVKSLSLGKSAVKNETVQRLMDMHNNDVIPVVYTHGLALGQLSLPIIGKGEVEFQNQLYKGREIETLLGWKPLHLKTDEAFTLITGTQFAAAYGLYCLIKTEKLLQETITIIGSPTNYFQSVKDAYDYVLATFIKQINISSEKSANALEHLDYAGYELALPLDFLSIAVAGLANFFGKTMQTILPTEFLGDSILNEINMLCTPVSIHLMSAENAGIKCLKILENAERIIQN
jgi:histidine ammonia-lyase